MGTLKTERASILGMTSNNNHHKSISQYQNNNNIYGINNGFLNSTINHSQRNPSVLFAKPDLFLSHLNNETHRVEKLKERQEEITLRKLEKEAQIRKRNEDLQKKWEKLEQFENDYKKEILAKSMQMSQKREQKIKELKNMEKEKEKQLLKEHERVMQNLHMKAKNITLIELERQREARKREEEQEKKRA
eukprot:403339740